VDENEIPKSLVEVFLARVASGWVPGPEIDITESDLNRLDFFLLARKAKILEGIGDKSYMVISSSPVYLHNKAIFNSHDEKLRALLVNPPQKAKGYGNIFCGRPYPTIDGLRADNSTPYRTIKPATPQNYIEVFTNGYVEFGKLMNRENDSGLIFASVVDTAYIVNFIRFIEKAYGSQSSSTPLAINLAVYNAQGMWLALGDNYPGDDKLVKWAKQHLELGKYYIKNIRSQAKLLPKTICDHMWQAFHREKANVFDDAGTFRV
jgi:hypothetical protein